MPELTIWLIATAPFITAIVLTICIRSVQRLATAGLLTLTVSPRREYEHWILTEDLCTQFNLTSTFSDLISPSSLQPLSQRDILDDLQNGANSLLAIAATRASAAAGHVESAISSVVASLPEVPNIENYVPMNCSFGTREFCIGYRHKQSLSCSDSLFNISVLLPDEIKALPDSVEDALRQRIGDLSPLADSFKSLRTSILICTLAGLFMMLLLVLLRIPQFYNWIHKKFSLSFKTRVIILLFMAPACCAPYFALAILHRQVVKTAEKLPDWVAVEKGEVFEYSIGLVVCAVLLLVILLAAELYQRRVKQIKHPIRVGDSVR
jgi:hypothetical protein